MPRSLRRAAAHIAVPVFVGLLSSAAIAGAAAAAAAPAQPADSGTGQSQAVAAGQQGRPDFDVTPPPASGPHDSPRTPTFGPHDSLSQIYAGPTGTPNSAPASTGGVAAGMDDAITDAASDASVVPAVVKAPNAAAMTGHPSSMPGLWDKGSFYHSTHAIGGPVVK